jgi:hypothetical protein
VKKLTDEIMAKALGWESKRIGRKRSWRRNQDFSWTIGEPPPPFTTSLDAIVAEIDARNLWFKLESVTSGRKDCFHEACVYKDTGYRGDTAPLALCHALLAYLKEKP